MDNRMVEEGVVIEVFDGRARVMAMRGSSCDGCGARTMCKPTEGMNMVIEAENHVGAHVGERVEVAMQPKTFLKASFIVYILPIIVFLLGGAIGKNIGGTDAWGAVGGMISLMVCYGGIWTYNKKVNKEGRYRPEIISVLSS